MEDVLGEPSLSMPNYLLLVNSGTRTIISFTCIPTADPNGNPCVPGLKKIVHVTKPKAINLGKKKVGKREGF